MPQLISWVAVGAKIVFPVLTGAQTHAFAALWSVIFELSCSFQLWYLWRVGDDKLP